MLQGLKRKKGDDNFDKINILETRVIELDKRLDRMKSTLQISTNQSFNIIKR